MNQSKLDVAETVKNACIDAARDGFREALISGLCTEGAMEAAISAIQKLDVEEIVKKQSGR
ncbi:MAG: acetyltransferase [Balneolaceae bacterium]|nr:acetyltransferase [Balneolaceae bacterium]